MTTTPLNQPAAAARRIAYRTPEAITVNTTSALVQGGGGGAGFDWWFQYYSDGYGR